MSRMFNVTTTLATLTLGAAALTACGPQPGGITAQLSWDDRSDGVLQRGLRAAVPPPEVNCLRIRALDTATDMVLAETQLSTRPDPDNNIDILSTVGGTWTLGEVEVGIDRTLVAEAFFDACTATVTATRLAFAGRRAKIRVDPSETTDVGVVNLIRAANVRIPRLDDVAPAPPANLRVTSAAEGDSLNIEYDDPGNGDVRGIVIALSTNAAGAPVTPVLRRGDTVSVGQALTAGVTVMNVFTGDPLQARATLTGLANGTRHRIFVYAYDTDLNGAPLNYSGAAARDATPTDTVAPGAISDLTVTRSSTASGDMGVRLQFTSPGEDGATGQVTAYELRTSTDRATLEDADRFAALPMVPAPNAVAAGDAVDAMATFMELGVDGQQAFFVGVRAVDADGNAGPIAVAQFTP